MNKNILQALKNQEPQLSANEILKVLLNQLNVKEQKYDANYTQNLIKAHQTLLEPHSFKVGDLVKWKEGLKNKKLPNSEQPAIVVQLLKESLIDRVGEEAGSTYYREPLDMILGLFDDDDEFLMFYYDKRRFELLMVNDET
ncbi:MAG: hypothetical protein KAH84_04415 [Thiomargarita sp.]|nr:hypothetical protein [Thiomargarita sp.]